LKASMMLGTLHHEVGEEFKAYLHETKF